MPKIEIPGDQEIKISDSTLRDGSQMPGIVLKKEQKLRIFEFLHQIGIEKLECFVFNERDRVLVRDLLDRNYEQPQITGWARANPADIDANLSMDGIEEVGILMSISDTHIFDKLGFKDREQAWDKYTDALQYAVDHGLKTRCHLEDITRADIPGFVIPLVKSLLDISPDTIFRVCDTLNYGVPFEDTPLPYSIPKIIQSFKDVGAHEIEMHVHDDFGLGVANTLAGYWHGANWSSLTFMGIGERAGNTELEKILTFLFCRIKGFEKYNPVPLTEFTRYLEHELVFSLPRNKAIVGENIFAHESGIHTDGVLKNPFTYEPFPPEVVGGKRTLLIGDSSGREVVRHKMEGILNELLGVEVNLRKNDNRIKKICADIHKLYDEEARRSSVSDDELREYAIKYFLTGEEVFPPWIAHTHYE
ncbi:MAG: isopropylmalate synthase [Euryarchaeota archaeon]|nr:isopropylmalate synthase [Euryarchaeota archaeon]